MLDGYAKAKTTNNEEPKITTIKKNTKLVEIVSVIITQIHHG